MALTWDNVDLNNGIIHVKHTLIETGTKGMKKFILGTPKTKSSYRSIHIGSTLTEILKNHKSWQLKNKGKYSQWYHNSNFVCTKENGANIKEIQRRLGHSKLATTMDTYSHITDKMKNDTVNIFENITKNLPPK